jgi:hypothetical protein
VNPEELRPFFSVRLYPALPSDVRLSADLEFRDSDVDLDVLDWDSDRNLLVVITESERVPGWAAETSIVEVKYGLHIYHYHRRAGMLFEYTTSDEIAALIREQVTRKELKTAPADDLLKVMAPAEQGSYLMVGLRKTTGRGPSHPSYKTLMGRQVQAAVRPIDGRVFAPGHALARLAGDVTRGIASMRGRVWSTQRAELSDFVEWCGAIGDTLAESRRHPYLPQLEFLVRGVPLSRLDERPIAVLLDDRLLSAICRVTVLDNDATPVVGDLVPSIEIEDFDRATGTLSCMFVFSSVAQPVRVWYCADATPLWQKADARECNIRVELSDDDISEDAFEAFCERFPPILVSGGGGVIIGESRYPANLSLGPIPAASLVAKSWKGCNIKSEVGLQDQSSVSVQDWVARELTKGSGKGLIVVHDHGTGELADFLTIEPRLSPKRVTFYHCKASGRPEPSDRVGDMYEVLQQACRTAVWARSPQLLSEIVRHTKAPRNAPIIKGSRQALLALAREFRSNEGHYRVVAVQPGCNLGKVRGSAKVWGLVVAAYQWLADADADFVLWGS